MKLGAFSMSLSVQNLETSKAFYEKIGFSQFAGDMDKNYLIMKNESTIIGLFQGMFPDNIITFNPGWDENASLLSDFDDVRALQQDFLSKGIEIPNSIAPDSKGPASFMITDPDGNVILIDQHV